ncbi:hypothetical protein [Fuerstiella marisgermanici]|nr:hypothetical protein [Fuerstiella marisgermanici]
MFEQRSLLGEAKSQQLVLKYHELLRQQSPRIDLNELAQFVDIVVQDPDKLLKLETEN